MKKRGRRAVRRKSVRDNSNKMPLAVTALVLNIFFPGLGTLIAGKINIGIWQLLIFLVGALFSLQLIGLPLILAAWIWALVTSIQLIRRAQ